MLRTRPHRLFLFWLLFCAFLYGVPTALLIRDRCQQQLNNALIDAIKHRKTEIALSLLNAGADGNAIETKYLLIPHHSFTSIFSDMLDKMRGRHPYHASISALAHLLIPPSEPDELWRVPEPPELPKLVKALLDHGADPNYKTEYTIFYPGGGTPLKFAKWWRYPQTTRLLIAAGAKE